MTTTDIVDLLISHEQALQELYSAYADEFPMYSEFWNSVAYEERGHAELISTLKTAAFEGTLKIDGNRFKTQLLNTMLSYLRKEKENIEFGGMSLIQALTVAREVERSMIERRFFEVFKGDPEILKKVLTILENDTRTHLDKINIAWQENRQNT